VLLLVNLLIFIILGSEVCQTQPVLPCFDFLSINFVNNLFGSLCGLLSMGQNTGRTACFTLKGYR
jgi:hypothetical protein